MSATRLSTYGLPIGRTRRLPSLWSCAGLFGLVAGTLLLVLPEWMFDPLVWLAEAFQPGDVPLSDRGVRSLHGGVRVWGWSGIIVASVTFPLWVSRVRTYLMAKFSRLPDRWFGPLPFSPDRYGLAFFIALVSVLAFSLAAHWALTAYEDVDWLEGEDGVSEWWSVATYLAAAGMAGATARLFYSLGHRYLLWLQLFLAALFLLGAMEEVSWGQRLFGWGTPAILREVNVQGETTLHNLTSGDSAILVLFFWGSLLAVAGGVLRAVWHRNWKVTSADFILPSLVLAPALVMILIWRVGDFWTPVNLPRLLMNYWDYAPQGSEVPEVLLGLCLCLYTLGNLKRAATLRRLRDLERTGASRPCAVPSGAQGRSPPSNFL